MQPAKAGIVPVERPPVRLVQQSRGIDNSRFEETIVCHYRYFLASPVFEQVSLWRTMEEAKEFFSSRLCYHIEQHGFSGLYTLNSAANRRSQILRIRDGAFRIEPVPFGNRGVVNIRIVQR